jgi:transposase
MSLVIDSRGALSPRPSPSDIRTIDPLHYHEQVRPGNKKIKAADRQLTELVQATGSSLQLHGIGPSGAARLLGDIADIARFASRGHFPSWNGTAPLDASSGDQQRHRLSRAGNRRINRALHIMAVVQLRLSTDAEK